MAAAKSQIETLQSRVVNFRKERDWKQFHTPKDTAISLLLEASELLEIFQWKKGDSLDSDEKQLLGEELSDVLYWVLLIAHDQDIDLEKVFDAKMQKNEKKYPVEKAVGSSKKYTEL